MQYIHIKKLEDYHPGYKDRELKWFKCYFKMINADPQFEMLCEIDKWRFVAMVMLELQTQKPIPNDNGYLSRKGFDLRKRSMSLTLQMLHNFLDVVTEEKKTCTLDKSKNKNKRREDLCNGYDEFVGYWNSKDKLPTIQSFTSNRQLKLNARMKEPVFVSRWKEAIDKVAASSFCLGGSDQGWKADVTWFLKDSDNYIKVLEGKYDDQDNVDQKYNYCKHPGCKKYWSKSDKREFCKEHAK